MTISADQEAAEDDQDDHRLYLWRRGDVCDVDIPEVDRPPPEDRPWFGRRRRHAQNLVAILDGKSPEQGSSSV